MIYLKSEIYFITDLENKCNTIIYQWEPVWPSSLSYQAILSTIKPLLLTLEGWIKYLDIQEFFFVSNVICLSISFLLNLVGSGLLCKARLDGWILMLCATSLGVCKIITRYNKINLDICHHKSCSVLWTMDVDERNFMTPGSWYGTIKCKYTQC